MVGGINLLPTKAAQTAANTPNFKVNRHTTYDFTGLFTKLGLVELRRMPDEKGRYTNVFLAAPQDKDLVGDGKHGGRAAPLLEITYNWDTEDYGEARYFGHLAFEVDAIYATCDRLMKAGVTINRPPRDGVMAFVRSPDKQSVELLQKGAALPPAEPWKSMPNTGNPNKVQRYTLEWAKTLEAIAKCAPRYILPGHGPAYRGEELCKEVLSETARALRLIHDEVVRRLNDGEWPADIVEADISIPADLVAKPYLQSIYGCVPFVVRDVIRRYAGWWSGEPSQMFPARRKERGEDIVALCGRNKIQ